MKAFSTTSAMMWMFCLIACPSLCVASEIELVVTETPGNVTDPNAAPWLNLFDQTILFETGAHNVLLAAEVDALPGFNENGLGRETGTLNFFDSETGLGFDFSITADATVGFPNNPATGFTYNDTEGGDIFRSGALSPGDVGNFDDDDVTFRFLGGDQVFGFGFDLLDSNVSTGESILVVDVEDNLLAEFLLPPGPPGRINNFFLGVRSDTAIGKVTFLENDGSDDIAIRDFRFAKSVAISALGDFDRDGDVDLDDLDAFNGNIGQGAVDGLELLDLNADGTVGLDDFQQHYETLVETANGGTGLFAGDLNLDGTVDVLNDAFGFVANLGNSVGSWSDGDFNADGTVNVLGDAFLLVGNLGQTNSGESASVSAVPEPGGCSMLTLLSLISILRRRRCGYVSEA